MRIGIISDLHMEFGKGFRFETSVDVLILAGDIDAGTNGIDWCRRELPPELSVVYVPGNHEFYHHEYRGMIAAMKRAAEDSNIHVLSNNIVQIGDFRFVGATLWTDYQLNGDAQDAMWHAQRNLSDHMLISHQAGEKGERSRFMPELARREHQKALAYLDAALDGFFDDRAVVVTHHAPSPQSIAEKYRGHPLNPCFASDLTPFIRQTQPALWVHGHVHGSFDYAIGRTRVVCNPRGYPAGGTHFENPAFDPGLVVELT
jgi:Icc-related predicted phosphoesterase